MSLNRFLRLIDVKRRFAKEFPASRTQKKRILTFHLETYQEKCKIIVNSTGKFLIDPLFSDIIDFLWYLA